MKRKWRQLAPALAALTLALTLLPCSALAMENGAQATTAAVYPAEVRESEENGVHRIEKVYYLTIRDDPAAIPTGDFEREGRSYTLLDVIKTDQTDTDTKDHIEVVTLDTDTKDMAAIIQQLEPALEVTTEDGYTGILTPDYPGIVVEAAGYQTSSRTVTATRSYPNLSDADTSLIPKTTQEGGRTLSLADVQWQEAGGFYNATATYTRNATGKYATGYTATVEYKGEVSKTSGDTVIYTAIFASHGETQFQKEVPFSGEEPSGPKDSGAGSVSKLILVLPLAALLGGAGFGGWKLTKYMRDKKRGYVK